MWSLVVGVAVALAGDPPSGGAVESARAAAIAVKAQRAVRGLPAIPASAWETAAQGKMAWGVEEVEGEAARKTWGVAVMAQPIDRVWGAINDERLHPEYTALSYAELVRGEACGAGRHVLQVLPVGFPGISDRWWVTIRTPTAAVSAATGGKVRELVWTNAPDGTSVTSEAGKAAMAGAVMVGFTRGAWLVSAIDEGHTLVEYYAWVHPGGSLPAGMMATFAGKSLRATFGDMERAAADPRVRCTSG